MCNDKAFYDNVSSLKVYLTLSLQKYHLRYGIHRFKIGTRLYKLVHGIMVECHLPIQRSRFVPGLAGH